MLAITDDNDDGGPLALLDWRRQVADLYAAIRAHDDPEAVWLQWRRTRDRLFSLHPQSPIEPAERAAFEALPFFPYDRALRLMVDVTRIEADPVTFEAGNDGAVTMRSFGQTRGLAATLGGELTLFWLGGYGGGLFIPFADPTGATETYPAGRYLLDTIKGADLGMDAAGRLILDFNFAYNPSCSYAPRWVCPLAPPVNRLPRPVRAGEMAPR